MLDLDLVHKSVTAQEGLVATATMATPLAKYCSSCGFKLEFSFYYCPKCGTEIIKSRSDIDVTSVTQSTSSGSVERLKSMSESKRRKPSGLLRKQSDLLSFNAFKSKKETERRSFFVRDKNKKKKIEETPVNIQVGIMVDKDSLTVKRGETLPLKVVPSSTAQDLLTAATEKHGNFNRKFDCNGDYRDGSEIINVPGTEEPFVLSRYKEESGFGYSRIILFLIPMKPVSEQEHGSDTENTNNTPTSVSDSDEEGDKRLPCFLSSSASHSLTELSLANEPSIVEETTMVECPTCFKPFPVENVGQHADECAEVFWADVDGNEQKPDANSASESSPPSLQSEIVHLRENEMKEPTVQVAVRRNRVWEDFRRARERYYLPNQNIKITFSGEPAIDIGGPKREFFAEMLRFVQQNLFLEGMPVHSTFAFTKGDFKLAGEIMVMSVLQNGQAPTLLSPQVFNYLCNTLIIEDIASSSHREFCKKLESATDDTIPELLQEEDSFKILEEIGYKGVPFKETKALTENIIRNVCIKQQVGDLLPQLTQFREGLSTCKLLERLQKSPALWEPVFVAGVGVTVTANLMLEEIEVNYSESQVRRQKEADTYFYFCDFIQALDLNKIAGLNVSHLLQWLTGSTTFPALGFPRKLKCQFLHGCIEGCHCRPTTSTCDLVFTLPVHLNADALMSEIMVSALKDCVGFGCI